MFVNAAITTIFVAAPALPQTIIVPTGVIRYAEFVFVTGQVLTADAHVRGAPGISGLPAHETEAGIVRVIDSTHTPSGASEPEHQTESSD